jgi:hypothetical protein
MLEPMMPSPLEECASGTLESAATRVQVLRADNARLLARIERTRGSEPFPSRRRFLPAAMAYGTLVSAGWLVATCGGATMDAATWRETSEQCGTRLEEVSVDIPELERELVRCSGENQELRRQKHLEPLPASFEEGTLDTAMAEERRGVREQQCSAAFDVTYTKCRLTWF